MATTDIPTKWGGKGHAARNPFLLHTAGARSCSRYGSCGLDEAEASLAPPRISSGRRGVRSLVILGAHVPFACFVLILALFTYCYHFIPLAPWLLAVVCADLVLIGAWPPAASFYRGRDRWDWFPVLSGLLAIVLGIVLGEFNAGMMEPWIGARFLHAYSDVLPSADPTGLADAGILHLAPGSTIDISRSAGYRDWPHTYCAAPILGADTPDAAGATAGLWAVGVDCCGSRGAFACDDAAVSDARAGLRVSDDSRGHFQRAVRMAAAAHSLGIPKEPLLLAWHQDPKSAASASWWTATGIFVGFLSVAVCCCMTCQWVLMEVARLQQ